MRRALVVALLVLPAVASAAVEGPSEDGAWTLRFAVERAQPGRVALALDVLRDDAGDEARGSRDLGARDLPAGASDVVADFLPAEGPGDYAVTLLLDGAPGPTLRFVVRDGAGGETGVRFVVPDEPTYLNLTRDAVNADGKQKAPGEDLVTRATLEDANGLSDVSLSYLVERDGASVLGGDAPFVANGTRASVEHRFARSPMPPGPYTLRLVAATPDGVAASAARTFLIRDVAPTLAPPPALAPVAPDRARVVEASLVVQDKNGVDPVLALDARAYRGSARTDAILATLGAPEPLPDAEGQGRARVPLRIDVPARAPAGSYRVSLYADGALLGSVPLDVRALPTLLSVDASSEDGQLRLDVRTSAPAIVRASLADGAGAATHLAAASDGVATLRLAPPARGALAWRLAIHATEDGPPLDERNGTWSSATIPLVVTRVGSSARGHAWALDAPGWSLDGATTRVDVERWDGAPEPRFDAAFDGTRVRLRAPADLDAGRYTARLELALPNGSVGTAAWSFDAGPWLRVALGAPVVVGREARIPVANDGGVTIARLVVDAPGARVLLDVDGATHEPREAGGRAVFDGLALAPGDAATLVVRLPDGPLPAGERETRVRVLAGVAP